MPDVGPKKALALYQTLGISSIAELEAALNEGRVRNVPGFGARTAESCARDLTAVRRRAGRRSARSVRGPAPGRQIVARLRESGLPIDQLEVAGQPAPGQARPSAIWIPLHQPRAGGG